MPSIKYFRVLALSTFVLPALFAIPGLAQDTPDTAGNSQAGGTSQMGGSLSTVGTMPGQGAVSDQDIAALDARLKVLDGEHPLDPENAALLAFKLSQAHIWQAEIKRSLSDDTSTATGADLTATAGNSDPVESYVPEEYISSYRDVVNRASVVQAATADAASTGGDNFQERAYFAADDGSPQPYWIEVPPNYDPKLKWPLVVMLHGYSPYISEINLPIPSEETVELASKLGFLLVVPYGRRNSDFVQFGEDDMFAVRNEVCRNFNVDPTRIFLTGSSMGGYGAWAAGLHTASQWDGLAPICGRTDFYLWFKLIRDDVAPWKRVLYDDDDPRTLLENASHLPMYVQHGAQDLTVPVEHSRRIVKDARRLKLPLFYREDEMGGHDSVFQQAAINSTLYWLTSLKPIPTPNQFTIIAGDLREAKNYWGEIEAFKTYGQMARLDVYLDPSGTIDVKTQNVARFVLNPPPGLYTAGQQLTLRVDGAALPAPFDPTQPIAWQASDALVTKTPAVCGPVKSAFRDPFLLVYGNADDKLAADKFRVEWYLFVDGWPPEKSVADVTDADKANYNLIFFGTRASNPLLASISDQLPMELTPTGYRFGAKYFTAPNVGLRMVWKSPWSPNRLIVVQSGTWWGEELPVNHKLDLLPDYIIYSDQTIASDSTNRPFEAGWFDGDWKLVAAK